MPFDRTRDIMFDRRSVVKEKQRQQQQQQKLKLKAKQELVQTLKVASAIVNKVD